MRLLPMKMNTSLVYDEDYFPSFVEVSNQWQTLIESASVLSLCFVTTIANLAVGVSLITNGREVFDFYLLSLCASDLLSSLIVVPLSLAATSSLLTESGHTACAVSGYLHVSLCAVRMYTLMWASVDRYLAVRKPLRYDGIQTRARCQCWVLFSWVTATCLCCPPLLGDSREHFYRESFLCLLDVNSMLPYSITLGCLVLIPSILTMLYTYLYIFTSSTSPNPKEDNDRNSSYHVTTFMVTLEFFVLWIPWGMISLLEPVSSSAPSTRFMLLFLGQSYITWTPLTLLIFCQRCRKGIATLCVKSSSGVSV